MSDDHITEPAASHGGHDAHAHEGPNVTAYLVVFSALCVFTILSFLANAALGRGAIAGFIIIMGIALCKAALVIAYFMHLIVDWRKVYFLIVPALVLGPMLVIVLWPDIVLAWRPVWE